jgi:hypothetical protein
MNEQSQRDINLLVDRRWDPRKAKGKQTSLLLSKLGIAFGVLYFVASIFLRQFSVSDWIIYCFLGFVVLPPLWYRWQSRQILATARKHDYFLCPWCRYLLEDLGDTGVCPECGVAFERELCRTLYKSAYGPIQSDWDEQARIERVAWRRAIMLRDGIIKPSPQDDSHPSPAS